MRCTILLLKKGGLGEGADAVSKLMRDGSGHSDDFLMYNSLSSTTSLYHVHEGMQNFKICKKTGKTLGWRDQNQGGNTQKKLLGKYSSVI